MEIYCIKCGKKREIKKPKETTVECRNGEIKIIEAICSVCGEEVIKTIWDKEIWERVKWQKIWKKIC